MDRFLSVAFIIGVLLIGGLRTYAYLENKKEDKKNKTTAKIEMRVDNKQNKISNIVVEK